METENPISGIGTSAIGQGYAFVLPEGNAAQYQMHLSQQHAQQLQAAAAFRQAAKLKSEEQYQKELHEQKLPEFYAPYGTAINDANTAWMDKWSKDHAATGNDPFSDPKAIGEYNDNVLVPARKSKQLGDAYEKLAVAANTDHDDKYTPESKAAVLQHFEDLKKDPMGYLDKPLPTLVPRAATVDDLAKEIKASSIKTNDGTREVVVPNSSGHKKQAYELLEGSNKWDGVKKQYGIDPVIGDIGSTYDKNGKRVFFTNPVATEHIAKFIIDNPEQPQNANILKKLNVDPADKFAVQKVQHAVIQQNTGYGKAVTALGNITDAKVDKENKRTFEADNNAMSHERLNLQREAGGRDKVRLNKVLKDENSRLQLVKDIHAGNADAVKSFASLLSEVDGSVQKIKGGIRVTIPEYVPTLDRRGNTIPGQKHLAHRQYDIGEKSGRSGRMMIESLLNKLPTMGKEASLKTEAYKPTYNDVGSTDNADDL